jgi:probable rRNA maturation factor
MATFTIDVISEQTVLPVDARRIRRAVRQVLLDAGMTRAVVSVAVVDDATIRRLNARYLGHDYATDALSFALERGEGFIEGEIIVSAETAAAAAPRFGPHPADELLLYVVHGALHLVGYDDATKAGRAAMHEKERHYMTLFRDEKTLGRHGKEPGPSGHSPAVHSMRPLVPATSPHGFRRKRRIDTRRIDT